MFVTHGGQNSFTESMAKGVPLVVVPGFADQPVNGRKAESLGLGLAVPRPKEDGDAVLSEYVRDLRQAMRGVLEGDSYRAKAREMAEVIQQPGETELRRCPMRNRRGSRSNGKGRCRGQSKE